MEFSLVFNMLTLVIIALCGYGCTILFYVSERSMAYTWVSVKWVFPVH
jgi:hypothetical protein